MEFINKTILYEFDVKDQFGAKWLKVFEHNSTGEKFFNKNNVLLNKNSINQYSILRYLSHIRKFNASYEFLLEYPEKLISDNAYIHWRQNLNPLDVYQWGWSNSTQEPVEQPEEFKYDILHLPDTNEACEKIVFQGLVRSYPNNWLNGMSCLLGVGGYPYWFYSIGSYTKWIENDTFPGPVCLNTSSNSLYSMFLSHHVKLWIRIQEYHNLFIHQCTSQSKYTFLKYTAIFISSFIS